MRKSVSIILAILILIGGGYAASLLMNREKRQRPTIEKVKPTVFTAKVSNGDVQVFIEESGRLTAKYRADLYAEVQGVMETTARDFKPGSTFNKGDIMVKIRENDYYANLQAQKSVLQNLITSVLPDLRLDYPDVYKKWDNYLKNFDMDKPIGKLPETSSDKEKFFITGKNIYTTYYNTKNLEIILSKYTLRAPFNGILTEALVNPGTVVRPGQKLGELIDPSVYELELAISKSILPDLIIGKSVKVFDIENRELSWNGKISRINGRINTATQTVQVFVEVKGQALREGMFLNASISAKPKQNAFELPRSLLIDDTNLYIVKDSVLQVVAISILHTTNDSIIIRGLEDGTDVVIRPVAGGYNGLQVIPSKTVQEL
jgi:membrane fusion protein (multidrug efflux system)